jgi:tRNA nucleotidyltransferase (CCA-adding enzyme)
MVEQIKDIQIYVQSLFKEPIYLVGGACRNLIMGLEPKDYDFCTPMTTEKIKAGIKGKHRAYCIGEKFGTIKFEIGNIPVEITRFRSEKYNAGNRKPEVEFIGDLRSDVSRRDFTINAIVRHNGKYIDYFGGKEDIKNKIIKAVGNPTIRFKEDPLRMLRACRFASQLGFTIEENTLKSIKKNAHHILDVSKERWGEELDKLLLGKEVIKGLNYMWETGLFRFMIPELHLQYNYNQNSRYHELLLHAHTGIVVANVEGLVNRYGALMHDLGKPFARIEKNGKINYPMHEIIGCEIVKRMGPWLRWNSERIKDVSNLVLHHLQESSPLRKADFIGKKLK